MAQIERPFPTEQELREVGINTRPLQKSDEQAANRKRAQDRFDKEDTELSPLNQKARDAERLKSTQRKADNAFNDF